MARKSENILIDYLHALHHRKGVEKTAFCRRGRDAGFRLGSQLFADQNISPDKNEKHY